jgi:hypothetical protein
MTQFSAGSQALGYIYQARYALYLILTKEDDRQGVAIESLDDIVLDEKGEPKELLQLKHHINSRANLTNTSPDLWKTLRVWSTYIQEGKIDLSKITLTLVTTSSTSENSATSLLRTENRNTQKAHEILLKVAKESKSENKTMQDCFNTFLDLSYENQIALLNSIYIIDNSPNILDVERKIKKQLILSVRRQHLNLIYERLEGWWFSLVIKFLHQGLNKSITLLEINHKIQDIRDQFTQDALPIDFYSLEVPEDFDSKSRTFVYQLQKIAAKNSHIERAIRDYYRAFQQRSRWIRDGLVFTEELEEYEDRLVDEWERYKDHLEDEDFFDLNKEEDCQKFGRKVFKYIDSEIDVRIRPDVSAPYVMRGSYHILADQEQPRVYWHPNFLEKLTELLSPIKLN